MGCNISPQDTLEAELSFGVAIQRRVLRTTGDTGIHGELLAATYGWTFCCCCCLFLGTAGGTISKNKVKERTEIWCWYLVIWYEQKFVKHVSRLKLVPCRCWVGAWCVGKLSCFCNCFVFYCWYVFVACRWQFFLCCINISNISIATIPVPVQ